jgi:drug/metabolite transporter (DMT)-like permease
VLVAGVTALISGLSVFVNSYGVHAVTSPAVYTTAKNLVATLVLGGCALVGWRARDRWPGTAAARFASVEKGPGVPGTERGWQEWGPLRWIGLAYVGVVGGGIAFVLFFDGLADTSATPAAFWRDTLVIWVAVLAVPFLRERVTWWNVAAITLLVVGEVAVTGGVGHLAASRGELLVLSASMLWAVEVVVAKILLRGIAPAAITLVRMGVGAVALLAYLAASGSLHVLVSLDGTQIRWALLTGLLLAAYVATWMTALARARALDVTSILVGSALVTALLEAAAGTASLAPQALGLVLIAAGAGVVVWMGLHHPELRSRGALAG